MKLKNKIALITGTSAGIGKKCAMELAKRGIHLVLLARRYEKLEKLKKKLVVYDVDVFIYEVDVTKLQSIERIVSDLQEKKIVPNILINNAGLSQGIDPIDQANIEDWERMIDTNIFNI